MTKQLEKIYLNGENVQFFYLDQWATTYQHTNNYPKKSPQTPK